MRYGIFDNRALIFPTPALGTAPTRESTREGGFNFQVHHSGREKDKLHKDHYEVYKNLKNYEKGVRDRSVWLDGRPKGKF